MIFAALFAVMFLGEGITTKLLIGGGFILIGNLIAQFEQLHIMRFFKKPAHEKAV